MSQCTYKGKRIAVKVPHVYLTSDLDSVLGVSVSPTYILWQLKRVDCCRDFTERQLLRNTSVLPLLGVTLTEQQFAMISEWMEDGNINEFIQKNPNVNFTKLVCTPFELCRFLTDAFSSLTLRRVSYIYTAFTWSIGISKRCVVIPRYWFASP